MDVFLEDKMKKIIKWLSICFISCLVLLSISTFVVESLFTAKNQVTLIQPNKDNSLYKLIKNPNYTDGFSVTLPYDHNFSIEQIILMSFKGQPSFIKKLMNFNDELYLEKKSIDLKVGDQFGQFTVMEKSENEIILGEVNYPYYFVSYSFNDLAHEKRVNIHTFTNYTDLQGKIYLQLIKPVHTYIMISLAKGILY